MTYATIFSIFINYMPAYQMLSLALMSRERDDKFEYELAHDSF